MTSNVTWRQRRHMASYDITTSCQSTSDVRWRSNISQVTLHNVKCYMMSNDVIWRHHVMSEFKWRQMTFKYHITSSDVIWRNDVISRLDPYVIGLWRHWTFFMETCYNVSWRHDAIGCDCTWITTICNFTITCNNPTPAGLCNDDGRYWQKSS